MEKENKFKFTEEHVKKVLPSKYKNLNAKELSRAFNKVISDINQDDPIHENFNEILAQNLVSWIAATDKLGTASKEAYAKAVKFVTLTDAGMSTTQAYCALHPEKTRSELEKQKKNPSHPNYLSQYAKMYSNTKAVQSVVEVSGVTNMLTHKMAKAMAMNKLLELMHTSKKEFVQLKAASSIISIADPAVTDDSNKEDNKQISATQVLIDKLTLVTTNQLKELESGTKSLIEISKEGLEYAETES